MNKKYKFFIVGDDRIFIKTLVKFLKAEGQTVLFNDSSVVALPEIIEQKPNCVLLDMMMPEMDGLEFLKQLRSKPDLNATKIVIISEKSYKFDRKRAFEFGANGYITKPIDSQEIASQLQRIILDSIELTFWGVHGTLPVPGNTTIKYGGNTSCVSLEFSKGNFFIFDSGTGIKVLSDHLMAEKRQFMEAKIFISHPHWDHINALPFFVPLYIPGNDFEICGPAQGDITVHDLISGQMDGVYFPIKIKEFGAGVHFRDLKEEEFDIDGIKIKTMLLNHPGYCLGYRVKYKDRVVCYITDNELYPESSQFYNERYLNRLTEFVMDADALITDCTYTDKEYESKIGWGHSSISQVVGLAHRAGVKTLYLFHHDLNQADTDIDAKLETAQALLKENGSSTICIAPKEKELFKI